MFKKLLSFSLVAIMLSVSVFTAFAQTESTKVVSVQDEALADDMEVLIVTNGEEGASVQNYSWDYYNLTPGKDWLLVKINIGEDWILSQTTMSMQTRLRFPSGGSLTACITSLTKTEFDNAKASIGGGPVAGLTAPKSAENKNSQSSSRGGSGQATITNALTSSYYGENSYVDGALYMAIQYDTDLTVMMQPGHKEYWKLTLSGKKALPVDSASVSTVYIAGNATSQSIDCDADDSEGLALDSNTKWVFYKMQTGCTYEDVKSVVLTVPAYKESETLVATLHLYTLTEEEWNAATAGGDRKLNVADKQNFFESPYKAKKSFDKVNTFVTKKEYTFDLTSRYAQEAKSGTIYLCVGYANNSAEATRKGHVYTPTLEVVGIKGEYAPDAVTTLDDSYLVWNGDSYSLFTTATSGKAMLIAASYSGSALIDAELIEVDAATAVDGVISGSVSLLPGENLKIFFWGENPLFPVKKTINF